MTSFRTVRNTVCVIAIISILPVSVANSAARESNTPTPEPIASSPTPSTSKTATPTPTAAPARTVNSQIEVIRALLNKNDFKAARTELLLLDKEFANNADINNLLGYSSRKLKDYRSSATYYTKALRINPNHIGALEYQGELFITTKKIADAKKNLQKLKSLCGVNCEEYKDLKKALGNL
jgi:tetratricopeptide (TPR) repeat protein